MRLFLIFLFMAFAVLIPFLIWGGRFEAAFSRDGAVYWLRDYGAWAWAAAIALLLLDVFLPVPATAVFSGLGFVYGALLGGLIGAAGSILSGVVAYAGCRLVGRRAAVRIAGEKDLSRAEQLFASVGGWLVALSRWLPIFSETVACLAGLARMPAGPFLLALATGSLPLAMIFAMVGAVGLHYPVAAMALSAGLPALIWPVASFFVRRQKQPLRHKDAKKG
jgi:uncharacterized membrane protein YdjX (TVP38/TMEM64 family)